MDVCKSSLNQSKTEFLLVGFPAELSKISDPSLLMPSNVTITQSAQAGRRHLKFRTNPLHSECIVAKIQNDGRHRPEFRITFVISLLFD